VLSEARSVERTAAILGMDDTAARAALVRAKEKMLAFRERRERPFRDDKILTSWNSLLIGALADAGRALGAPSWVSAAEAAFAAIEQRLLRGGRAKRFYMPGEAEAPPERRGFLDDQAYLGNAAVDLYEATGNPRYLGIARDIADAMIAHYEDRAEGGFYFAADDGDKLIARTKDVFDQAAPSGTAMAALLCQRLSEIADARYAEPARRQLDLTAAAAIKNPLGLGKTVAALDRLVRGTVDVVIVGNVAGEEAQAMARVAFQKYLPHRNIVWVDPKRPETTSAAAVLAEGKVGKEGKTVAYVCRDRTCSAPIPTAAELATLLGAIGAP